MSFSSKIWKTLSIWLKQTKLERFMIIKTWGVRIIFRLEINVKIRLVDICNFVIAVISGCWELLFYSLIDCIVNEGLSYVVIKSWVLSLLFYSKLDWKTLIPLLATLGFFSTCRNEVSVKSKVHSVVFFCDFSPSLDSLPWSLCLYELIIWYFYCTLIAWLIIILLPIKSFATAHQLRWVIAFTHTYLVTKFIT